MEYRDRTRPMRSSIAVSSASGGKPRVSGRAGSGNRLPSGGSRDRCPRWRVDRSARRNLQRLRMPIGVQRQSRPRRSWLARRTLGERTRAPDSCTEKRTLVLPAARQTRFDALSRQVVPQWWAKAGVLIAADADGPCRLITSSPPLVGWYARCETELLADRPSAWLDDDDGPPTYVVLGPADHRRRPERLAAHQDLVDSGRLVAIDGTPEDVDVYRAAP